MSTGQVHFPAPSIANEEQTALAGKLSYLTTLRQQALAQWWGNFVPIDQWTPPTVKRQFESQRFQRYDMSLKTWLETLDSNFGDSEPGTYEKCFAGVTESIEELSAMFEEDWAKCLPALSGRSADNKPVTDEIEVDELMDDDSLSYDLRWTALPASSEDDTSTDEEPAYDLRGSIGSHAALLDEDTPPDVGSGKAAGDPDDEGPIYDLGWGATPSVVEAAANDEEDGPTYNLGWGQPAKTPELMDVTPQAEITNRDNNIIDLTGDDGPSYDLGWGSQPLSLPGSAQSSSGGIEIDVKPDMASLDYDPTVAKLINCINQQMKAIGNTLDDEHAHAIVQNAAVARLVLRCLQQSDRCRPGHVKPALAAAPSMPDV
ncbi:hypothetical protein EV702DRAFT_1196155 [Suillus placidus]|uniref:Uncharacterized protein n=1 Tax=Suillus placidus TaxID=48579 RepID=A0A9P6ZXJ6_9AGAM|nr:hypothetical protein EV702DRAFT_1196155 [Suillus placidus]